jgi:hypothetical protein
MRLFVWGLFVGVLICAVAQLVMGGIEFNIVVGQNSIGQLIDQLK